MRRFVLVAAVLFSTAALPVSRPVTDLLSTYALNGTPKWLGTITSAGTSINNLTTAVPFSSTGDALKGKTILVQCDAVTRILPGLTNAASVTTAIGVKLAADERVIIMMRPDYGWLAVIGTTNCNVWELL